MSTLSEYSTPASTGTEDDGAGTPGWAGAMAQIDAEIDELRALLERRRAAAEASRDDGAESAAT
ncbi:MAG: hypothetical protein J2P24_02245 [Streptosporangiales bacterium]|nr:hypothetical protein [Streptosporangiales bacterium]MBO0890898.1 hypothetical protein [Acidothermales bacterium]